MLHGGYSTISLGYLGLYEVTKLMTGESQTTEKGSQFAKALMNRRAVQRIHGKRKPESILDFMEHRQKASATVSLKLIKNALVRLKM